MKRLDLVLGILASPVLCAKGLCRAVRHVNFLRVSYQIKLVCRNCGAEVSLVGQWECSCHYRYQGHVLRKCPVCASVPRMVRCFGCGISQKLPKP